MSKFSTITRLPKPADEYAAPERARLMHFSNGIQLQIEFGTLSERARTGERYYCWDRSSLILNDGPDARGEISGLFPDALAVKFAIAEYLIRRDQQHGTNHS